MTITRICTSAKFSIISVFEPALVPFVWKLASSPTRDIMRFRSRFAMMPCDRIVLPELTQVSQQGLPSMGVGSTGNKHF